MGSGEALANHIEDESLTRFVLYCHINDAGGCLSPDHGRLIADTAAIIDALYAHLGPCAARLYSILEINVV